MSIFVPLEGTYLVVRIDPVATIKYFEDPDITAAARKLPTKKYIGYVSSTDDYPRPQRPYHRCRLEFVGQGIPKRSSDTSVQPGMCVPIAPITELPIFREPLFPWPKFPFENCYQYSFMNAVVRIPTQVINEGMTWKLSTREIFKHIGYLVEDDGQRELLSMLGTSGSISTSAPAISATALSSINDYARESITPEEGLSRINLVTEVPRGVSSDDSGKAGGAACVFAREHGESSSASGYDASTRNGGTDSSANTALDQEFPFMHDHHNDADFVPVVHMSIDLTEVNEVADPHEFMEEQAALYKLIELAKSRQLARWKDVTGVLQGNAGNIEDLSDAGSSPLVTPRKRFGATKLLASGKKKLRRLSAALAGNLPLRKLHDQ